jgi:release factor glutamine methyltransferase
MGNVIMDTMLTIAHALHTARARLSAHSESASSDAQTLLAHVIGVERTYLLTYPEQALTPEQRMRFDALLARRAQGEPLPYLLGMWHFYDRQLIVTPAVLIPRPETELLLEAALRHATPHAAYNAIDVGTGSGALAVTFAALRPHARVFAVDVSAAALQVAQRNAQMHNSAVRFVQGDLLTPFARHTPLFDCIMANLPYIPSADVPALPVSQHEPALALDGGDDGLRLIARLIAQSQRLLKRGGCLLLEIQYDQGARVEQLAREHFTAATIHTLQDYAGLDRIVQIITH